MPAKCKAVNRSLLYPETPMQAQAKYLQWDLHIYTGKRKGKQEGVSYYAQQGKYTKCNPNPNMTEMQLIT